MAPSGSLADAMAKARAGLRRMEDAGIRIPFLAGAEQSLAEFLEKDPEAAAAIVGGAAGTPPGGAALQLSQFLGAQGPDERLFRAAKFLETLFWNDTLTCAPFLSALSELEYAGAFHRGYRDHVTHSVLVYLLGAYLVRVNGQLGKALGGGKRTFPAFLKTWRTCALFHDAGYLFETDDPATHRRALQLLRDYPFELLQRLQDAAPRACRRLRPDELKEKKIFERALPPLQDVFDLFSVDVDDPETADVMTAMDAFAVLDRNPERPLAGLKRGFRGHFDLCRTTETDRPPYLDHGIMSALLLLKLREVEAITLDVLSDELAHDEGWPELLAEQRRRAGQVGKIIARAATAIAVHNINPDKHHEHGRPHPAGIELVDRMVYKVRLDKNPLSFLLRLSDSLQDWDRRLFRSSMAEDGLRRPRSKQDVAIDVSQQSIIVRVCSETPADTLKFAGEMNDLYFDATRRIDDRDSWLRIEHVGLVPTMMAQIPGAADSDAQADAIKARAKDYLRNAPPELRRAGRRFEAELRTREGWGLPGTEIDLTRGVLELVEMGYSLAEAEEKMRELCRSAGLDKVRTDSLG